MTYIINSYSFVSGPPPTGSQWSADFNQPDGPYTSVLPNPGWGNSFITRGNRGATDGLTTEYVGAQIHGLAIGGTTDWEVEFDMDATLVIGGGGVNAYVVASATGQGYSVFGGNATHIQRQNGYSATPHHDNLTNDNRINNAEHIVFKHWANGNMRVYLDGVPQFQVNDTTYTQTFDAIFVFVQASATAGRESYIDNLVLRDYIT